MNIRETLFVNSLADTSIIKNWTPPEVGVHQVGEATYNDWQAIRLSYLKLLETHAPATVAHFVLSPGKDTPAFRVGSGWHCATLEPDSFTSQFVQGPNADYRSNAYKNAKLQAEEDGKTMLACKDYQLVLAMRDSLYCNPINVEAKRWLEAQGQNELSVVSEHSTPHGPLITKSRIDCYQEHPDHGGMVILDLKSTGGQASLAGFTESADKWGYIAQLPFYKDSLKLHGLPVGGCYFLPQEKTPPYAAAVYRLSDYSEAVGRLKYREWLATWALCVSRNNWPGHAQQEQKLELR